MTSDAVTKIYGIEEAALRREFMEEVVSKIPDVDPLFFSDGQYKKSFVDGEQREIYMIFLISHAGPLRVTLF